MKSPLKYFSVGFQFYETKNAYICVNMQPKNNVQPW